MTSSTAPSVLTEITDHKATVRVPAVGSQDGSLDSQAAKEGVSAQKEEKRHSIGGKVECSGIGGESDKETVIEVVGSNEQHPLQVQVEDKNHNRVNSINNRNGVENGNGNGHEHEHEHVNGSEMAIKSESLQGIGIKDERRGVEDEPSSAASNNGASSTMESDPESVALDPVDDFIFLPYVGKREGDNIKDKVEESKGGHTATCLTGINSTNELKKSTTAATNPTTFPSSSSSPSSSSFSSSSYTIPGGGGGIVNGDKEGNGEGGTLSKNQLDANYRKAEIKRKAAQAVIDAKRLQDRHKAYLTEGLSPEGKEMDISALSRVASMAAVYLHLTGASILLSMTHWMTLLLLMLSSDHTTLLKK